MDNLNRCIILIGGSVRAAAEDAKRAGFRVFSVDRFGDRDLRSICDSWAFYESNNDWPRLFIELPRCPVVPCGGFQWPSTPTGKPLAPDPLMSDRLVAFPSPTILAQLNSPEWLGIVASEVNVSFPETWVLNEGKPARVFCSTILATPQSDRWIAKPIEHAGGVGIRRINEPTDISPDEICQRLQIGKTVGANFISYAHQGTLKVRHLGTFAGITYRKNPRHPFLYGGSYGPLALSSEVHEKIQLLGQLIAQRSELLGLFNLDLILGRDGSLTLLEVNARYSASMELLPHTRFAKSDDSSLIDWHLRSYEQDPRLAEDIESSLEKTSSRIGEAFACKRIIYCQHDSVVRGLRLDRATDKYEASLAKWCDLPIDLSTIRQGDPICTLIVMGNRTLKEALTTSRRLARYDVLARDTADHNSPRSSANE